jgi:5-methyltetrahydrofolate--homocysteine methyltransferase
MMAVFDDLKDAIVNGDADRAKEVTEKAVHDGCSVEDIVNLGLIAGMNEIGVKFKQNQVYVPDVLVAARAMHFGMAVIKPMIAAAGIKEKGTMVIGTVEGDLHDIGKNLVIMMMEGAGYKVIDLGINVPAQKFAEAIDSHKPQFLGLSALLTTTLPEMKKVIDLLKEQKAGVKIIVGGAPVSQEFANQIGADAYSPDAASCVDKCNSLLM